MLVTLLNKLPSYCILCDNKGIAGKDICNICLTQLLKNDCCCYQCGMPLEQTLQTNICGYCQSIPPSFDRTYAPFIYQGVIRYLITNLKFNQHYKNARLLGQLFSDALPEAKLPQCIIPVPLHKKRYRQRGFNQCLEIAKTVGRKLQIPIEAKLCIRHRNTAHQVGLATKERRKNVENAFSVIKKTNYTHIAILDDVMTTGSTLREVALVLKKSGIITIELWVCARA